MVHDGKKNVKLLSCGFLNSFCSLNKNYIRHLRCFSMNYLYDIIKAKKKELSSCFLSFMNSVKKKRCRVFILKYMWKTVLSCLVSKLTGRGNLLKNNSIFEHNTKINSIIRLSNFIKHKI